MKTRRDLLCPTCRRFFMTLPAEPPDRFGRCWNCRSLGLIPNKPPTPDRRCSIGEPKG